MLFIWALMFVISGLLRADAGSVAPWRPQERLSHLFPHRLLYPQRYRGQGSMARLPHRVAKCTSQMVCAILPYNPVSTG